MVDFYFVSENWGVDQKILKKRSVVDREIWLISSFPLTFPQTFGGKTSNFENVITSKEKRNSKDRFGKF